MNDLIKNYKFHDILGRILIIQKYNFIILIKI